MPRRPGFDDWIKRTAELLAERVGTDTYDQSSDTEETEPEEGARTPLSPANEVAEDLRAIDARVRVVAVDPGAPQGDLTLRGNCFTANAADCGQCQQCASHCAAQERRDNLRRIMESINPPIAMSGEMSASMREAAMRVLDANPVTGPYPPGSDAGRMTASEVLARRSGVPHETLMRGVPEGVVRQTLWERTRNFITRRRQGTGIPTLAEVLGQFIQVMDATRCEANTSHMQRPECTRVTIARHHTARLSVTEPGPGEFTVPQYTVSEFPTQKGYEVEPLQALIMWLEGVWKLTSAELQVQGYPPLPPLHIERRHEDVERSPTAGMGSGIHRRRESPDTLPSTDPEGSVPNEDDGGSEAEPGQSNGSTQSY